MTKLLILIACAIALVVLVVKTMPQYNPCNDPVYRITAEELKDCLRQDAAKEQKGKP